MEKIEFGLDDYIRCLKESRFLTASDLKYKNGEFYHKNTGVCYGRIHKYGFAFRWLLNKRIWLRWFTHRRRLHLVFTSSTYGCDGYIELASLFFLTPNNIERCKRELASGWNMIKFATLTSGGDFEKVIPKRIHFDFAPQNYITLQPHESVKIPILVTFE